ncbi:MAG: AfsR/SARP family transcriptional regulator, partial [Gemmatimonadales bacterium]
TYLGPGRCLAVTATFRPGRRAMIMFRTLGSVSLTGSNGVEVAAVLTQPKRLALLTVLAVAAPGAFQRRDTLLAMFWPSLDQTHARQSLRKAVHVLRRALGSDVLVARGDEELTVVPDHLWCDAAAFERAVTEGRPADALELYRGDLLEGFFVAEAPEFEHWHERERARLRDLAAQAAWTLAETAAARSQASDAIRWARRAAAFTPDDEAALRELISVLTRVGDRAAALRAYDEFAERLEREFGVRPSAFTRRMVETVKHSGDFDVGPPA